MDIEIQNEIYPGYPPVIRGISYSSRMISKQYGKEYDLKSYDNMKKAIYSIWIMPQSANYLDGAINAYEVKERVIQGHYHEQLENYDKIYIISVYLSKTYQIENKYAKHDEILTPLSLHASRKKEIIHRDYGFKMTESIKEEMNTMCNLSDAIEKTTKKVTKEVTN